MSNYSPEMYKSHNANQFNINEGMQINPTDQQKMYASNPNFNHNGGASKSTRILEPLFPNNGSM